jgi:hypothetical protein
MLDGGERGPRGRVLPVSLPLFAWREPRGEPSLEAGHVRHRHHASFSRGIEERCDFNLTVRLLSQYTGRGPTKARTFFNDDMVTVVLQDTLTKGRADARRQGAP